MTVRSSYDAATRRLSRRLVQSPHVMFVAAFDWHRVLLTPLVSLVSEWADTAVVSTEQIATGWSPDRAPDLLIVCDAGVAGWMRELYPETCIVHIGHGLISKNQTAYHYSKPDYICVASGYVADVLRARGHTPRKDFLPTGLIQTDPLFARKARWSRRHRRNRQPTIVYAPTWNPTLTSAAMFGENLVQLLRGQNSNMRILIKPHPHIAVVKPEWIEMWRDISSDRPAVTLCDHDADLIPVLLEGDLLVSDASSAFFHFLALDRPIVLMDNPDRFRDPECFDPAGIEWQWRDIGSRMSDVDQVQQEVHTSLSDPTRNQDARRHRRSLLFGNNTDGKSRQRINSSVKHIVRSQRS